MMNPPQQTQHQPTDLREYLRVLRARKVAILVMIVLAVGAALAFSLRQSPIYEGQAKVIVQAFQDPTSSGTQRPPNLETERELILSNAIASKVQQDLHLTTPVPTLLAHAQVQVVTDTQVLLVKYDSPSRTAAAQLANGFAQGYTEYRAQQAANEFQAAAAVIQKQIDGDATQLTTLSRQIDRTKDTQQRSSLESQRNTLSVQEGVLQQRLLDLESTAAANTAPAQIVQPAGIPTSPVRPKTFRNCVVALFLGLALGIAVAFVRERLDDRMRGGQELERRLGAPVLAAIPRIRQWRKESEARLIMRDEPHSPFSEAYRTLATNILYLASQEPMKVFMITSALRGEGKSTTAANLAVAMAESGRRVILVSADLRRSRTHQFFGLTNDMGVTDALSDSTKLPQVVVDPGINNLRVVNAGHMPDNPTELLRGRRAEVFIQNLRDAADFVLLDTPPVLAVADASIIAPLVDGTIYVINADSCSRAAMIQARDHLTHAGARVVGGVYNNFDPSQRAAYPYYYNHYYEYYGSPENSDRETGAARRGPRGHRRKVKAGESSKA